MYVNRRSFLRSIFSTITGCLASLHLPEAIAAWPERHFDRGEFAFQFQQLFGGQTIVDSNEINITLPEVAENGAVVPITISSELEQVSRIYIWVEKNPTPLAAEFEVDETIAVYLTARIKMAESCPVIIIVEQGNRLLRAQQWVKVMQGGCGTG